MNEGTGRESTDLNGNGNSTLDMTYYPISTKDKTIKRGVPLRTPQEIEQRGAVRSTSAMIALDILTVAGFLLFLYASWRYFR